MRCKAGSSSTTRTQTWRSTLPRGPGSFGDEPLIAYSPFKRAAGGDDGRIHLQFLVSPAGARLAQRDLAGGRSIAGLRGTRRPGADHTNSHATRPGPAACVARRAIVQ